MLSYIKLVDVISRDLAPSQWQQIPSLESSLQFILRPLQNNGLCCFQLQVELLWVIVLVAVAGPFLCWVYSFYSLVLWYILKMILIYLQKMHV